MIGKPLFSQILAISLAVVLGIACPGRADWSETFGGNAFDLDTWLFECYPKLTGTFTYAFQGGPEDDGFLAMTETSPSSAGGSQFGVGIGAPEEFADIRVGAVVNAGNLASRSYHGLAARIQYFMDTDGSLTGYPGIVPSCYTMLIHYQDGPANLRIELLKIVTLLDNHSQYWEIDVPGLGHGRSYYAELEVIGSNPVYITSRLYESRGGTLLASTPTLIDTNAQDDWENGGAGVEVIAKGQAGVFGMTQRDDPPGYHVTYDTIYATAVPGVVVVSPAPNVTGVSASTELHWIEPAYATSRQLYFGKAGAMEPVSLTGNETTYNTGVLEFNQSYQWRVDLMGPAGTVTGNTWSFNTGGSFVVDDFESYGNNDDIAATWIHDIPGDYDYVFLESGTVHQGEKALRFEYQNQYEPYTTQITRTFTAAQDWTQGQASLLSLSFTGKAENVFQTMSVILEDEAGHAGVVDHPYDYAVGTRTWSPWDIALAEFSDAGVDLAAIQKLSIRLGSGVDSGQAGEDRDVLYFDEIVLRP
jgi:hypothetical protein